MRAQRDGYAIEVLMERGAPLPAWAKDCPLIQPGDEFYMKAFWELSTTRPIGFGMGQIPWNRIVEYGARAGLDDGMLSVLVRVIRALDAAYLTWHKEEQDRKSKAQGREYDRQSKTRYRRS